MQESPYSKDRARDIARDLCGLPYELPCGFGAMLQTQIPLSAPVQQTRQEIPVHQVNSSDSPRLKKKFLEGAASAAGQATVAYILSQQGVDIDLPF